jgi:alpha-glucosidase
MYVVYESALQMLCDSPSTYYREEDTTKFISQIPTTWDKTIVLDAKIGDYVLIARRKGMTWYIGAMTDWSSRDLEIDFSFLPDGNFSASIMMDGINADRYAQDFIKDSIDITNNSKLNIKLAPGGGWAAIIKVK